MMKKTFTFFLLIGLWIVPALAPTAGAQEFELELDESLHPHEEGAKETPKLHYPDIKPEFSIGGGYRIFSGQDSSQIPRNMYELRKDTPVYLLEGSLFRHPDRLTLDLQFPAKTKDHFVDMGYGYRDLVLIRGINRAIYHNLENYRQDDTGAGWYNPQDAAGDEYGLRTMITNVDLRLKTPGFPAHLLASLEHVLKDGTRQQRFVGGAAYFNSREPSSKSRDVKLSTHRYGFGLNSHLGPVEAQYLFQMKNLDVGGDEVLYDSYTAAGFNPFSPIREAGTWEHNRFSELKGYKHTLKLHTMYTGKLTGSATFSFQNRENEFSDAEDDELFAGVGVTWMPVTRLKLAAKYRFQQRESKTPETVTVNGTDASGNTISYGDSDVRPAIDYSEHHAALDVRYRALDWLSLWAGYVYEQRDRETERGDLATEWHDLAEKSSLHRWSVKADTRPVKTLRFKVGFENEIHEDPAYNIQPDTGYTLRTEATWDPIPYVNVFADYARTWEDRKDLVYLSPNGTSSFSLGEAENRDVTKDRVSCFVSALVMPQVSVSLNYAYFRDDVRQDLEHGSGDGSFLDPDQPWKSEVHMYGATVNVEPTKTLHLDAGVNFIDSKGRFSYSVYNNAYENPPHSGSFQEVIVNEPVEVGSLSEVDQFETIVTAALRWDLPDHFGLGVRYQFSNFDQRAENGFTDLDDGSAHVIMVTLSKVLGREG